MALFQVPRGHSNGGIFSVFAISFVGLLLLFGWQTWLFVNWLFPDDQLLMKCLTLFSFDVMAFLWMIANRFYRFAHPSAKSATRWGKWITFSCSGIASVIYMTLAYIVRFQGSVSPGLVMLSETVSMVVLVVNILLVMVFLGKEIEVRYPNEDEYELVDMHLVGRARPQSQARLASNQDFNLIEEEQTDNQVETVSDEEDNQLETNPQLEIPFTHNGPAKKSWGGPRRGTGRKGK